MKSKGDTGFLIRYFVLLPLILATLFRAINSQGDNGGSNNSTDDNIDNPAAVDYVTQIIYDRFANSSEFLTPEITKTFRFCIKDMEAEWNSAFDFSRNLSFLSNCIIKTKGDLVQRLCTAAEIKYYFSSFRDSVTMGILPMKLNRNCNLTTWLSGCQPGWACSVVNEQRVNFRNSKDIPDRTDNCQPCCEGFFCPHGLTCMIPCPLGSYCPIGSFNKTTGVCDPYHYQLPQGQPNHTCGGADIWADISSSGEVFCPAGSYCPTTAEKVSCSRGHYCRTGSTSQSRCLLMTKCDAGSSNQNITAYGVLLFVGITSLLLLIYNCSDQVLATRDRRLAKSREAAAKSARETAQARDRWKSAKDAAKKHAVGLQRQLSHTFSRKKSAMLENQPRALPQTNPETDASLPTTLNTPNSSQELSKAGKGKKHECSDLANMMTESEEDRDGHKGFNFEIGDKNLKNVKTNQFHTHSQIFKYAYGQIEKEKALQEQNDNLTFSGILSAANYIEIMKRPTLEVAFKDLTLTLKGKKKHLLRCVTGKISPGKVSAVMGPSGAGKTTFLSALAGKATGCKKTGMILINGKADSTHSYKRIIGFVPQDDIVHGNLTVEENLWFSARCRLSADLSKAEKVLVLERVIESLGLQTVRDCLVGTVEKRGISGGQRKRVNVGLEMVMEPSLLILDEPTSGLDSSSSLLLLRALRREALEGVNICMVVHQPSYALFKMFDVLILLAKGGLVAYLGPAKKVEEYFSSLGITVPERVNPPDHYIDILEGVVKPNSDVNYRELPIRWMLHNGYPVPLDLLSEVGLPESSQGESSGDNEKPAAGKSFARDLWQDMKCNVQLKKDYMLHNFLKLNDQSNRKTPGIFQQYRYFLGRAGKQRLREARIQAVDYLILLLAGACLGTLAKVSDETFGVVGYTYTVIAVSLLCKIAALRSFSLDKLHYWRESASGMSSLAFFLAKDTIDHFNTIVKPLVYLSMFYFFNNPRSSVLENYVVLLCLVYCVTGIAYVLAIFFAPGQAQLWSVLLPVVLTLIASQENGSGFLKKLQNLCYTKWALEAFVIANAQRYSGVWLVTRCGALYAKGYDVNNWELALCVLIATGIISRIIAFNFMILLQRK
ncbi:ABC transporter G family member 28-like [Chenopodium quinoa]|uniref:ABC transporter G family member 28-like n=1 Tax=Chenopodium quinoa TaxID=63459 RepID=UPI000B77877B|nr:ABC transporter G family member 28-like [Chenopodium quinoa]